MPSWLAERVVGCWRSGQPYICSTIEVTEGYDAMLYYKDLGQHVGGEFSMAVVQANQLMEDRSQVESSPYGTFIGIYDGHGGPEAAVFIKTNLFPSFLKYASEQGCMSVDVLQKSFQAIEEGFESLVSAAWKNKPHIAAVGSCCLVGVIFNGILYIANLGDSRAVMGVAAKSTRAITPIQLTTEHNAGIEAVRQELKALHPGDSDIVVLRQGVWRVKGIIQVSRSIGDVYLKKQEFNREPLLARFRLSEPLKRPALTAEPTILLHKIGPEDQFLIFASDGLWEHLSNEEAAEIVQKHPRMGIARRLVRAALGRAAKKRELRYNDLRKLERGIRRHFHDDISVVVVFLNHDLLGMGSISSMGTPILSGCESYCASSGVCSPKGMDTEGSPGASEG
eukprot:c27654_g1_i2 orf=501-1682(-)